MTDLDPSSIVPPPAWSLAVGSLGKALIILATVGFALAAVAWFFAPRARVLRRVGAWSFTLACSSLLATFVGLAVLFVANRFEFEYVWGHADSKNAIPYRIAGIWSGQEGSFLLWACAAALFALITVRATLQYRRWFTIAYSVFLGAIANILAFESPFNLNTFEGKPFVPIDGMGLAPSLQNYWVTIHPPVIFLGFGSLTVLFALAVAALVERDFDSWIPIVRPWAIVSVTLVGVGLCMGGLWAYETLGWGGFWMWDPVENVSFVPWCFTVAFVHGVIVQATKKTWKLSNLLMGALPFLVFLYGTFLTRSGFLSDASVHSFAEMDRSALKLLIGVMVVTVAGFAALWGVRVYQARKVDPPAADSTGFLRREPFYLGGSLLMVMMGLATMIGMSVPLVMAIAGKKPRVVEEGLYHQVLPYIFIPIMVLMAVTPFVTWRAMKPKEFWSRVYSLICIAVGLTGVTLFLTVVTPARTFIDLSPTITMFGGMKVKGLWFLLVLAGLCYLVIAANIWRVAELARRTKLGLAPFFVHVGVAILMAGLIVSRGFEQHDETIVMKDHPGRLLGYEVRLKGMTSTLDDRNNRVEFEILDPHRKNALLMVARPGLYNVKMGDQENVMVWPSIERGLLHDVYVSLGPPQQQASQEVNVAVGKKVQFGGMTLTYEKMVREGEMGQTGTMFGAQVRVTAGTESKVVVPKLEIGSGGETVPHPAKLDDNMELVMAGMNAADKSVTLRVQLNTPMYPVEIFHKPLVGLVWLGTTVMTIAGMMAATYRRKSKQVSPRIVQTLEEETGLRPLIKT